MIDNSGKKPISDNAFGFTSFGITVEVQTESPTHTQTLKDGLQELFRNNLEVSNGQEYDFKFEIKQGAEGLVDLFKNGELLVSGELNFGFFHYVETLVRLSVAEFAVDFVFVHAGVVSWKGAGIVIPGNSFAGKTSLVREFVAAGAEYLSDEYAVFDRNGLVHPFPKPLSLREKSSGMLQVDHLVEDLGGVCAAGPVRTAYILHTSYKPEAVWQPNVITSGTGILKLLEHTLPIRVATQFSLEVFNNVANDAVFLESPRGEAPETVGAILEYIQ